MIFNPNSQVTVNACCSHIGFCKVKMRVLKNPIYVLTTRTSLAKKQMLNKKYKLKRYVGVASHMARIYVYRRC